MAGNQVPHNSSHCGQNGQYHITGAVWKFLLFVVLGLVSVQGAPTGVKIGLVCNASPDSWQNLFRIASAMNIAIDRLVEKGIIQNNTIER